MRWIKASERLPEDFAKGYYLRFITPGSFGCLAVGLFYKNELNETVIKFYSGTNGECSRDEVEWLDESLPASLEQEAERLYPNKYKNGEGGAKGSHYMDFEIADMQRSAHITAARQYMGTIEKLKDVLHIDQTGLAAGLAEVNKIVEGYRWVTEGRGPYEWNDDKYKEEMGNMLDNISEAATKALNSSGAIAHSVCCEKPGRTATMEGIGYIKKDAHDKEIERLNDENHKLMAEIDTLSEELGELKNIQEGVERLRAENEKLRKALEYCHKAKMRLDIPNVTDDELAANWNYFLTQNGLT